MDALQSLLQKSLVRQVTDDRFDLLMSVQEYAAEHLRTAGRYPGSGPDALLAAEARHGAFYADRDEKAAIADDCADLGNFIAACRRAAAHANADVAAQTLQGAWAGLSLRGPFRVGVDLATLVQGTPGLVAASAARVHWVAGCALAACGRDAEANAQFDASLAQSRAVGDRYCECRALISRAGGESHGGRMEEARVHFEAALLIASEIDDRTLQSDARNGLGIMEIVLGRTGEAEAQLAKGRSLAREAGDRQRECRILANLGILYINAGRMDEARSHDEEALAVAREIGNRVVEANIRGNLGLLHQVQGRFAEALEQLEAALPMSRELGHTRLESIVLCNLGMVYDGLARFDEARDRFEAALAVAREVGDRHSEGQFLSYLGLLHARQANFIDARRCLDSGEKLLRAASDRSSLGVLLCSRAETEYRAGVADAASAARAEAEVIAAEVGAGPHSELGVALARVRQLQGIS